MRAVSKPAGAGAAPLLRLGLDLNTQLFQRVLEPVSERDFTRRLTDRTNSMQWIAGHLVDTRAQMVRLLGAEVSVEGLEPFRRPLDPTASYPAKADLLRAWREVSGSLERELRRATPAALTGPAPMRFPVAEQTIGGAIAFFAQHEGYHIGQLGLLRKACGYAAVRHVPS